MEWTDAGGRYECADGDIFCTIAREFCEETYHMAAITRRDVIFLAATDGALSYVTDNKGTPVYASLAVHTDALRSLGAEMLPAVFLRNRELVLRGNPFVPADVYSTIALGHLSWAALAAGPGLSSRLRQALEGSLVAAARSRAECHEGAS
jgi:hypothetical protein